MNGLRFAAAFLTALLIGSLSLSAQEQGETTSGKGKLEVVDQFDWGNIAPGKLTADIAIKNSGDGPLAIEHVKPSCGCTAAPLDDYLLEPGQTTTMHISLDAAHSKGPISKSVAIYSDDPLQNTKIVRLMATIVTDLTFEPDVRWLVFNNAVVGQQTTSSIRLINTSTESITIYPPELAPQAEGAPIATPIAFNLTEEKVLAPGQEFEVVASATPQTTEPIAGKAIIRTSSKNNPTREFTVYGNVTEAVQATESVPQTLTPELGEKSPTITPTTPNK